MSILISVPLPVLIALVAFGIISFAAFLKAASTLGRLGMVMNETLERMKSRNPFENGGEQ